MKKILLSIFLMAAVGAINQSQAQCSGANTVITNFTVVPNTNSVLFGFDWTYDHGNASIEVAFLCNGVQVGSLPCLPNLKDSAAGVHHVGGQFNIVCNGVIRVEVRIWTNNSCGGTNCIVSRETTQIGLPVTLTSFTAARVRSNVSLSWETATELNNTGFSVESKIGNGNWQEAAFIPSQAPGGNSTGKLQYQYTDPNNTKGITQYRLNQKDINGKSSFSEVRAVRGEGQVGKTIIFPNPSNDGKINVVFEDGNGTRDLSVMDMSGRIVKQMKGITNNNIQIDNLTPGLYSLRVVVRETGDQVMEKIVVNKR